MKGTSNRGFASMDAARQREIARKGGQAAHRKGTAHEFNSDEAREAGRKGGERVSANRQHMAEIGRRGGQRSSGRRKPQTAQPVQPPQQQPARQAAGGESSSAQQRPAAAISPEREVHMPADSAPPHTPAPPG